MPVELVELTLQTALPVHLVAKGDLEAAGLAPSSIAWAKANGFSGEAGRTLVVPGESGALAGALFGIGDGEGMLAVGALARALPEGDWHFASGLAEPELAAIALALGGYVFTRYGKKPGKALRFTLPSGADAARVGRIVDGVFLTRNSSSSCSPRPSTSPSGTASPSPITRRRSRSAGIVLAIAARTLSQGVSAADAASGTRASGA